MEERASVFNAAADAMPHRQPVPAVRLQSTSRIAALQVHKIRFPGSSFPTRDIHSTNEIIALLQKY